MTRRKVPISYIGSTKFDLYTSSALLILPTLATTLEDDTSLIVNGQFALTVAFSYLKLALSEPVTQQLLYILTYRSTDPNALIFVFEMANFIKNGNGVVIAQ